MMLILSLLINSAVVALVVGLHYEFLRRLSEMMPRMPIPPRSTILVSVFGAILAHSVEIWIFAVAYWLKSLVGFGSLAGEIDGDFLDNVYFSFVTYTTVGYGDIYPLGNLRFLAGVESLVGLVLITWTASFLFLEMSKYWHR